MTEKPVHLVKRFLLGIFILALVIACTTKAPNPEVEKAIAETQTAVAQLMIPTATQPATATLAPTLTAGPPANFEGSGITFTFNPSVFQNPTIQIVPSTKNWLPAHLRLVQAASGDLAGGVPDYFQIDMQQPAGSGASIVKPFLRIIPIRNADVQFYPALQDQPTLVGDMDQLQVRINEHKVEDRFFSNTMLEVQRKYIDFRNGKGVRYITSRTDKPGEVHEINHGNLVYVFEGITSDTRYYIEGEFIVDFAQLADFAISPEDLQKYQNDSTAYADYVSKIDWQMKMLDTAAFMPDLVRLDELIATLNVNPVIAAPTQGSAISDLGFGEPTFSDTFEKPPAYIFLGKDPYTSTEAKDGSVIMASSLENADRWRMIEKPPLGDAYTEIVVRSGDACSGKDGFGQIVRATPDGSNYNSGIIFTISCDGQYRIYKLNRDRYAAIREWTANPNILAGPGRTNRVGVVAKGITYQLYVNSALVDQFEDDSYDVGSFGIVLSSPETADFRIYVDELAYWNLYAKAVATAAPTPVSNVVYLPLGLQECETLQMEAGKVIGNGGTRVEYPFLDSKDENARGNACHIEYSGTGEVIQSFDVLLGALDVFPKLEWSEDAAYAASGVFDEMRAYRKAGDLIAIVRMTKKPAEGVECPTDTPASSCVEMLAADQVLYTFTIDAAIRTMVTPTPKP